MPRKAKYRPRKVVTISIRDRIAAVIARHSSFVPLLRLFKAWSPCLDCSGYFHPHAMEFDHRPGETKSGDVSKSKTRTAVLREIPKCDLVCANCHRIRTHTRIEAPTRG